ncbi:MAG TPA: hypothetical protein HPP94_07395 [Desulfuromonadales bacterium]|nr:hypothetical protein [Desulfuromonadales bacterium]
MALALINNTLYALVPVETQAGWLELADICKAYLSGPEHEKLHDYLQDDVKAVLVEKSYIDKDYRDTYSNFYSKKFANRPSTAYRLHFFNCLIPAEHLFSLDQYKDNYIGYSVIRPTQLNAIGRTILDPCKLSRITGMTCATDFSVHLFGVKFTVKGFPYISQDSDVTICAHAAAWMAFRYFSERYSAYREVFPYEITQLSRNVSLGRLLPSKGITAYQITEIFSNYGFYPEIYSNTQYPDNFYRLLYYYIESGIPVVACTTKHAITIIGHVSDYNLTATNNNSEDYLTGYVANDDNHWPYQLVLRRGLPESGHCSKLKIEDLVCFISPLYEKMYLSAEHIEGLTDKILEHPSFGVNAVSKLVPKDKLIKRIFLTSSRSYKKFRRENPLPFGLQDYYLQLPMPKFIWICELSMGGFYPNKQIVGEIIFDATASHRDRFSFLAIHYPDFILFNDRDALGDAPNRFKYEHLAANTIQSYAMYINNLREI